MPAYLILEIDWHDEEKASEYRQLLGPTLEKHGARTLAANAPHPLEGDWNPRRLVIIEFPTMAGLLAWYGSPEYAPLIRLRNEGSTTKMLAIEPAPRP